MNNKLAKLAWETDGFDWLFLLANQVEMNEIPLSQNYRVLHAAYLRELALILKELVPRNKSQAEIKP